MRGGRGRFAAALLWLILLGGFATAGYGIYAWNAAKAEEYAQLDILARFAAKSANLFFDRFDDSLEHLGQDIIDHGGLSDLRAAHTLLARYQRSAPGARSGQPVRPGRELGVVIAQGTRDRAALAQADAGVGGRFSHRGGIFGTRA